MAKEQQLAMEERTGEVYHVSRAKLIWQEDKMERKKLMRKKDVVELSLLFAATTTRNKEDVHHGVFLFGAADTNLDTIKDQVSRFTY